MNIERILRNVLSFCWLTRIEHANFFNFFLYIILSFDITANHYNDIFYLRFVTRIESMDNTLIFYLINALSHLTTIKFGVNHLILVNYSVHKIEVNFVSNLVCKVKVLTEISLKKKAIVNQS